MGGVLFSLTSIFRTKNEEIGIVGCGSQKDRADQSIHARAIVLAPVKRIVLERVRNTDSTLPGMVPAEHDEMPERIAMNIIRALGCFPGALIEKGPIGTSENWIPSFEDSTDQSRRQVTPMDSSSQREVLFQALQRGAVS